MFRIPEKEIRLYHGTVRDHRNIDLGVCRDDTDFGQGYYLTTIPFQAEDWAKRNGTAGWVYEYVLDWPREFHVLCLEDYNEDWLGLITYHRLWGIYGQEKMRSLLGAANPESCDIILGGMADNARAADLPEILKDYWKTRNAKKTLNRIRPRKNMDQFCFKTEAAVHLLTRRRAWKWTRVHGKWIREDRGL